MNTPHFARLVATESKLNEISNVYAKEVILTGSWFSNMELLAPAGNWDSFLAAMNNGADAVYLGGKQYSARQTAANFDAQQMRAAILHAHGRGRKIYVTVNTLIDNDEFTPALDYLYELHQQGADAVIIQDMGLLKVARAVLPDLPLHGSTQMTIHNQEGARFLLQQGLKRVVLARELEGQEIKTISQQVGMELEVFVHGALCYSYSGQCLFSSMIGRRSGNRGMCAQPCRLPYELYRDNMRVKLPGRGKYLLSPADLCLIGHLPELAEAGITSLKIEGRMKRAEYVAVVTGTYRQVLDQMENEPDYRPDAGAIDRLQRIFNRQFSTGYFMPEDSGFMSTELPKNRGVAIGWVIKQKKAGITCLKLTDRLRIGDGIAIHTKKEQVRAGLVKEIKIGGIKVIEAEPGQKIEISLEGQVNPGDAVFKTHDQELLEAARQTILNETRGKIPVDADVYLERGQAMKLEIHDQWGHHAVVNTMNQMQEADRHPLDKGLLRQKIGRLGNTPFELRNLNIYGNDNLILPFSDINAARRRAIEILSDQIAAGDRTPLDKISFETEKKKYLLHRLSEVQSAKTLLTVAVSNLDQAETAIYNGADRVYLSLEGLGSHKHINKSQLQNWMGLHQHHAERLIPILPRIHKPGDHYNYRQQILETGCSNVMIASWADLEWASNHELNVMTDYNMNIYNRYTLNMLLDFGIKSICLSPELNMQQLTGWAPLQSAELIVHGDLILMESQYCILGGKQTGRENCSLACRQGSYYLKDAKGYEFPLATDADCRLYVFNSRPLCLIQALPCILALKPASIRIEARQTQCADLGRIMAIYREALNIIDSGGQPDLRSWQQDLNTLSRVPFTKGHYYRGVI